ncbi:MAG: hypothetical protein CL911_00265 [Deltaproteobacteria bacterium]|nr:hypothetical protein [Deltaproteobacteria bacterium]
MTDTLTSFIEEIQQISTLLNPKDISRKEWSELYTKRWLVEVDLKSIKDTMQMEILRKCKKPGS